MADEEKTVRLPAPRCTFADHSYPAYSQKQVEALLKELGYTVLSGFREFPETFDENI
jgi:hypothetical protein